MRGIATHMLRPHCWFNRSSKHFEIIAYKHIYVRVQSAVTSASRAVGALWNHLYVKTQNFFPLPLSMTTPPVPWVFKADASHPIRTGFVFVCGPAHLPQLPLSLPSFLCYASSCYLPARSSRSLVSTQDGFGASSLSSYPEPVIPAALSSPWFLGRGEKQH